MNSATGGLVIGIDEAGLGPNLGPLVLTATVWQVDLEPQSVDFWSELADVVTSDPRSRDGRLVITDSKALFQPHQGLQRLEASVWSLLASVGCQPRTFRELIRFLQSASPGWETEPWLQPDGPPLPVESQPVGLPPGRLAESGRRVRLLQIASRVVEAAEFNRLLTAGNKSDVVTGCHLGLLRQLCAPYPDTPILVLSDKHGGRNKYAAALTQAFDGAWVTTLEESAALSVYRLGNQEFRFQPRGEALLPIAAASLVCKYVREVSMGAFNRFWQAQVPGLQPTQGYPVDARRFAEQIDAARTAIGVPREHLWRRK